jgi:hypothetical protein
MPNVHVIFPEKGKTIVDNDPEALVAGRCLEWHFHSERSDVAKVGIEFEDPTAQFFRVNGGRQNHFEALLAERPTIWVKPPRQKQSQTRWKYTIRAWDANGNELKDLELDPQIILDEP